MNFQNSHSNQSHFLSGGGEMGALMREKDWDKTALGPPDKWPSSLKNLVRLLLDNGSPMYIAWGAEFSQFYNDSFSLLLTSDRHQHFKALGQSTKKTFADYWSSAIWPLFEKVLKGDSTFYEDLQLPLHRNGSIEDGFFTFSLSPLRNEMGEVEGVMVIANETTKRVLGDRLLEEERERLRLIADKIPAFISYMDSDGKYKFVNRTYSDWSEKPRNEIEGFTRKDFIEDSETYEYLRYFEERAFEGEKVYFDLLLHKKTGEPIYLDMEYLPDIDPDTGKVRGVISIGIDVTIRKEVEASEERYRSLTDTIPQMMWASTPAGVVNFANERCLQYTGLSSQTKYRDGWIKTIHDHDFPQVNKSWLTSMETGQPFKEEYRIKNVDGEYRWFSVRANPVRDLGGNILYWNVTATDIEDHKKIERELESAKENAENANATKTAFLANMSHEIRTPLGAILGFSELLKSANLSSELRDQYIETISRNGKSLTRIIDDILDLAKVEAGRLDIEHIDFALKNLLSEVVELLSEKTKQKGIYLNLSIDENVPPVIYSDPTRLRQIFINIIGNAVKFTDVGGVDIRVRSIQSDDGTIHIAVEVADTGRGLTEEQRIRLFEPFTQADNTTTRQFGGTGLGLALSKRLSEALGGTITIDSFEQGEGCTFIISFVAMMGKEASGNGGEAVSGCFKTPDDLALKGMKILFADDSPDNQFLVEHFLSLNGADVSLASDGSEAVDKALAGKFDVILMDIQMPKMDGYQATKILLDRGYKTPIIALTAHAMDEEREKTRATGFAAHLTKPLNFNELLNTLVDSRN
ncbi:MAG: PAS domain S-box protein [Bacteriovorax sp.]